MSSGTARADGTRHQPVKSSYGDFFYTLALESMSSGATRNAKVLCQGRNTTQAVGALTRPLNRNKKEGLLSMVITLGLTNAFYSAWAPATIEELRRKGVEEDTVRMVDSFLRDRKALVDNAE